jgi:single-stranded DNA-binding protein
MSAGIAYFAGKVSLVEAKQLANGMDLVKINLEMLIEGFDETPATAEIIQLSIFGKKAAVLKHKLEQGDNFAMVTTDVRCRPYKNKDGVTKAFPSFNVRNIVTERRGKGNGQGYDSEDQVPF